MKYYSICFAFILIMLSSIVFPTISFGQGIEYKVLATNRTSTMEKELNQAAAAGFRFEAIMGGETLGGSEAVAIMSRKAGTETKRSYEYKLLATNKTSTMQKELQQSGDVGFAYKDQTVFRTTFGGKEVVTIMERDLGEPVRRYEYKLLATFKTSTMDKELKEAGSEGYEFVGMSVGKTITGNEVVAILQRLVKQ
jgi:hypothetical protein